MTARAGRLGVVVVNYGSSDLLEQNLVGAVGPDVLTVVVDNLTTSDERAKVEALTRQHGWVFLPQPGNEGFGRGANIGAAAALEQGCDVVVLLNPDVRAERSVLSALAEQVRTDPLRAVSPRIVRPDGSTWFAGAELLLSHGWTVNRITGGPGTRPWLTGACLVVHRDLWTRVGGFDEDLFLYWEDVELSYRIVEAGGSVAVCDDLQVEHSVGGTQDAAHGKSSAYLYYNTRNRLLFAARHLGRKDLLRWLAWSPRYAERVVRRGRGRRALLMHPVAPVSAVLRGSLAGKRVALQALLPLPRKLEHERVRVYQTLRSAHLERAKDGVPASIVYGTRRYDFDEKLAQGVDIVQTKGALTTALTLLVSPARVVEVNEPFLTSGARRAIGVLLAAEIARLRKKPLVLSSYLIGNLAPWETRDGKPVPAKQRIKQKVVATAVSRRLDRVVFGTDEARRVYARALPSGFPRAEVRDVPALPAPCTCAIAERDPGMVLFVGVLNDRKGFPQLKAAWPAIAEAAPGSRLSILGVGPMEDEAVSFAGSRDDVTFTRSPERTEIHAAMRRANLLVLLSQPRRDWREQIGLPLVEALSHGCPVLATTETGIASWLAEHGHGVVAPDAAPEVVAAEAARLLADRRSSASVLADLPEVDGRLVADAWLLA